jgi:hypothetical protein
MTEREEVAAIIAALAFRDEQSSAKPPGIADGESSHVDSAWRIAGRAALHRGRGAF